MSKEPSEHSEAASGDAAMQVEVLPPELVPEVVRGVTLRGEAARDVTASLVRLGGPAAVDMARQAAKPTYRLVPSPQTAEGIADKSLRWATTKRGDASPLIKDAKTGRIAGRGDLQKVKPNPAKLLGPAAWEAMAMATQQHYLVEINDKLESIERGVDEVLSRMDDDKLGTLNYASRTARSALAGLADGRTLSPNTVDSIGDAAQRTDEVWHQLHTRAQRTIAEYHRGKATAAEVEQVWALLVKATQTLGECSTVLTAIPYATVEELRDATAEERERALAAIAEVRPLADDLQLAHGQWASSKAEWELRFTRNPAKKATRRLKGTVPVKPQQQPLDYATVWRASQLGAPPAPPEALLVTVHEDGRVLVVAEPAATDGLP
jgi:hypothetical protein